VVFVVVSILLLVFTKPIAVKFLNVGKFKSNAESLVGKRAIVISEIDNLKEIGEVTIQGLDWSARTEQDGVVIPKNAVVVIKRIEGVKLIVDLDESLKNVIKLEESDAMLNPEIIEQQDD
jgi:membrane protein implicated in regulation of membrane protease activity